jgi:hypothetical protein
MTDPDPVAPATPSGAGEPERPTDEPSEELTRAVKAACQWIRERAVDGVVAIFVVSWLAHDLELAVASRDRCRAGALLKATWVG